ncbi:MAG: hypothetical protein K8R79_05685, partial [Calditrichales bacterium]|nr:hypothetical protein [Calditrichales bacterium]
LNEKRLRQLVLIPLLKGMGFSDVYEFHGVIEKGKDLIFREVSQMKEVFIHASVVSVKDITGSTGDSKSSERILDQVRMALEEPFVDLYTGKNTYVDRCWVITSGRILPTAIESISGHLHRSHLDKLVRFIDGTKLVSLVDESYPEYWKREKEITYYSHNPMIDISTNTLADPFNIDVDDLPNAGSLKDSIYQIKKLVNSILLTIEFDITDKLAEILRSNHPWEVISKWESLYGDVIDHRGHAYIGSEVDKVQDYWQDLVYDILEYEKRHEINKEDRNIPKKPWEK